MNARISARDAVAKHTFLAQRASCAFFSHPSSPLSSSSDPSDTRRSASFSSSPILFSPPQLSIPHFHCLFRRLRYPALYYVCSFSLVVVVCIYWPAWCISRYIFFFLVLPRQRTSSPVATLGLGAPGAKLEGKIAKSVEERAKLPKDGKIPEPPA